MISNVVIKNLALIEEADIPYGPGLNIMTGETGSGKSIIIGAVNIALGEKANKSYIRTGCQYGMVEIVFSECDEKALQILDRLSIERQGTNITITRKITQDATVSKINGETASLNDIKALTPVLVDIHGQHEHQSLLNPQSQLQIIDNFGKKKIYKVKDNLKSLYHKYQSLRKEYQNYQLDDESIERERSLLEFQLSEINDASLIKDEDITLETEFRQMCSFEKITGSLSKTLNAVNSEQGGVSAMISKAILEINDASLLEPDNVDIKTFKDILLDLDSVSKDLGRDLAKYIDSHKFDQERFNSLQKRLNLINRLKEKYGKTVNDIQDYADNISYRLKEFSDYRSRRDTLVSEMNDCRSDLNNLSVLLSETRKETAVILSEMIRKNLLDLNFLNVDFEIIFNKTDKISENGFDRVDFMLSTNPGECLSPLAKIASGGELSRIMLAIKSSVAENDEMPTMIFDEIDTGISGKTAQMVGEKLKYLSKNHQIICITHLPQIAAMADAHFKIHKQVTDGNTISGIQKLDESGQINEVAGLLSGIELTQGSIDNAKELINRAREI